MTLQTYNRSLFATDRRPHLEKRAGGREDFTRLLRGAARVPRPRDPGGSGSPPCLSSAGWRAPARLLAAGRMHPPPVSGKLDPWAVAPPRGFLAFGNAIRWGPLDIVGGSKHSCGVRRTRGCSFVSLASPRQ